MTTLPQQAPPAHRGLKCPRRSKGSFAQLGGRGGRPGGVGRQDDWPLRDVRDLCTSMSPHLGCLYSSIQQPQPKMRAFRNDTGSQTMANKQPQLPSLTNSIILGPEKPRVLPAPAIRHGAPVRSTQLWSWACDRGIFIQKASIRFRLVALVDLLFLSHVASRMTLPPRVIELQMRDKFQKDSGAEG